MTHPIKQVVATAVLCLAAFLPFVACKKESPAKDLLSGKEATYIIEREKASFSETTNLQVGQGGTTPTEGQGCKVTSGANAGKTGTYSRDSDGSLWCEGSWGGTECGTNKCTSASLPPRNTPGVPPKIIKAVR